MIKSPRSKQRKSNPPNSTIGPTTSSASSLSRSSPGVSEKSGAAINFGPNEVRQYEVEETAPVPPPRNEDAPTELPPPEEPRGRDSAPTRSASSRSRSPGRNTSSVRGGSGGLGRGQSGGGNAAPPPNVSDVESGDSSPPGGNRGGRGTLALSQYFFVCFSLLLPPSSTFSLLLYRNSSINRTRCSWWGSGRRTRWWGKRKGKR